MDKIIFEISEKCLHARICKINVMVVENYFVPNIGCNTQSRFSRMHRNGVIGFHSPLTLGLKDVR